MSRPGVVFSREQLLNAVWGQDRAVTDRTVDVYVLRLRQKIEPDPTNPTFIHSVRGFGYSFNEHTVEAPVKTSDGSRVLDRELVRIHAADRKQREFILRPLRWPALFFAHVMISAAIEKQRPAFARFKMLHAADVERVVARGMNVDDIHHEVSHRAADQRETVSMHVANMQPRRRPSREMVAQRILILGQHADAEAPRQRQDAVHIRAIVERNQDQRRIERDRNERIGRHAVRLLFVLRRKNRDAAGEAS